MQIKPIGFMNTFKRLHQVELNLKKLKNYANVAFLASCGVIATVALQLSAGKSA